jgi:hypothetical protein
MFVAAEKLRLREIERREAEQRRLEAARQRQEIERQRQLEEQCRQQLDTMVALQMKIRDLRSFLEECENSLSKSQALSPDGLEERWLRWAYAYAESIDPLKNGCLQKIISSRSGALEPG